MKLRLELKLECFDGQVHKSKMTRQLVVTCQYWARGKTAAGLFRTVAQWSQTAPLDRLCFWLGPERVSLCSSPGVQSAQVASANWGATLPQLSQLRGAETPKPEPHTSDKISAGGNWQEPAGPMEHQWRSWTLNWKKPPTNKTNFYCVYTQPSGFGASRKNTMHY